MRESRRLTPNLFCVLVLAFALALLAARSASAQKQFSDRMRTAFGLEKDKTGNCHLCHKYDKNKKESPERDNLDAYGLQLQKAAEFKPLAGKDEDHDFSAEELNKFEAAVRALWDKDADGDGATNGEEISLGAFPGDPASTPPKEALEKYRKEHGRK